MDTPINYLQVLIDTIEFLDSFNTRYNTKRRILFSIEENRSRIPHDDSRLLTINISLGNIQVLYKQYILPSTNSVEENEQIRINAYKETLRSIFMSGLTAIYNQQVKILNS